MDPTDPLQMEEARRLAGLSDDSFAPSPDVSPEVRARSLVEHQKLDEAIAAIAKGSMEQHVSRYLVGLANGVAKRLDPKYRVFNIVDGNGYAAVIGEHAAPGDLTGSFRMTFRTSNKGFHYEASSEYTVPGKAPQHATSEVRWDRDAREVIATSIRWLEAVSKGIR